jgi:uncharacterized membrane protein HdeD (DUF308 family)
MAPVLRSLVIALGALSFLGGLVALVTGLCPPAFVAIFWGAILLLGTIFERFRYKPIESVTPGAGWTKTSERFIDDETGKPVTVWLDPASGERKYVKG